ncbi:MAG: Glutamate 5-kinase [Herbinix sp.]|jgi:glutamate 5-kinase|nr:Glutamate 5-kinase [Herbinix sp.]
MLSAVVAVLCQASKLIILSDIDGFYDRDPRLYPDAKLIQKIENIDDKVYKLAGGAGSRRGTGGMRTKILAASLAMDQGINVIITNGKRPEELYKIIEGKCVGTLFQGKE